MELGNFEIGILAIISLLVLIQAGMHIAFAMITVSFLSVWLMKDFEIAGKLMALAAAEKISFYIFGVIPLFVMMGLLIAAGDIGKDTFTAANRLFSRLKGGLAVSTVGANAVFAAVTGTSIASASIFTKVAVPEMIRHSYTPKFAVGVVAGSSVLGMLIPPSLLLIIYGVLTETSVGDLFIAGIIPGVLLALAFVVAIYFMSVFTPKFVKQSEGDFAQDIDLVEENDTWKLLFPIVILMMIVLGGIYGGLFTPTEAGGVGTLGALIIGFVRKKLTIKKLWGVAMETGYVTSSICFLLISAQLYASMLTMTGIPGDVSAMISEAGLNYFVILLGYVFVLLILGTFLDSVSIMLIVLPFVLPLMEGNQIDLVWFGIVTVLAIEVGLLTPPLGMACFVIQANLDDSRISLTEIFTGAFPFMLTMIIVLGLIIVFPSISLALL